METIGKNLGHKQNRLLGLASPISPPRNTSHGSGTFPDRFQEGRLPRDHAIHFHVSESERMLFAMVLECVSCLIGS